MKITESYVLPADPARVYDMLCERAYQERKIQASGALSHELEMSGTPEGLTLRASRKMPTDRLPDIARKVVGERLTLEETQEWGPAAADGSRTGRLTAKVPGTPAKLDAQMRLVPEGDGTRMEVDGDFSANVPLVGKKLEQAAGPLVGKVVALEKTVSTEWLAGH